MEITYALFWFLTGAVLNRALSTFFNQREQRNAIVSIMSQFLSISLHFKDQMQLALDMKKKFLMESELDSDEVNAACLEDQKIVDQWMVVCTTVILKGAPKSYVKYFQKTDFKDFKSSE